MAKGVYFLANNKVYDLAVAFLNSFRAHNDLPLCLIPFNKEFDKIAELSKIHDFSIFDDEKMLNHCDEISRKFHKITVGAYRKLCIWHGEFDEFIYIDLDTIVTNDVSFAFNGLNYCDVLTTHSNLPENVRWVWKDSIYDTGVLSKEEIGFAANTGFIASTKNFINFEQVDLHVNPGVAIKEHMVLFCMEQPFLNYLFIKSGKKYSSLYSLLKSGIYQDVMFEVHASKRDGVVKEGKIEFPDGNPVFLVHWAGYTRLKMFPYWDLWLYYRNVNKNIPPLVSDERMTEPRHLF